MLQPKSSFAALAVCVSALCVAAWSPAAAEDLLVTQYKTDPSGAPYGVAIEKGFFKKAGVDVTGVISGEGGGSSVRAVIASSLGFGETSPAAAIAAISQGQDLKIVNIGIALARRQRHHRDAGLADQIGQGPQGQEIRHQQSEIARRDDDCGGGRKGRA